MKSVLKILLFATLKRFPKFNSLLIRVHQFSLAAKFSGATQERYLEILGMFKPSIDAVPLVRFGQDSDGGYVLMNGIDPNSVCISMGIADNVSFDKDLSPYVKHILMFDFSISESPLIIPNSTFYPLRIVPHMEKGKGEVDVETIFEQIDIESPIILKVDIEGSEWDCFKDVSKKTLNRCHQIVFEFHNLQVLQFQPLYRSYIDFLLLLNSTHTVVNSHINNWDSFEILEGVAVPNVMEVTFVRKDLIEENSRFGTSGNKVNFPNNPLLPEFRLNPFDWVSAHSN